MATFHHYTKSTWADGAAMYAANKVSFLKDGDELIIINKTIGAWEVYYMEENNSMSAGSWNYSSCPSEIGLSIWLRNRKR